MTLESETETEAETEKDKRVCFRCVGEAYLKGEIKKSKIRLKKCDYCGKAGATISIGELTECVDTAFDQHYQRTATGPDDMEYAMMGDREGTYNWERQGSPVADAIAWEAEVSEEIVGDILTVLNDEHGDYEADKMGEETPYGGDSHYERKSVGGGNWLDEWRDVEKALRNENRFFSPAVAQYLKSLFADIDKFKKPDGSPVVVDAGPETGQDHLYRARVFQAEGKLVDALGVIDRELAPPPMILALAGRMNARGISVFYGATHPEVARAEIRPPVGSQVLSAKFKIVRPLRLLDIAALGDLSVEGSVFDPAYGRALERAVFLETLSEQMTRPVMPDDEALDYVVTQVVADYLATQADHPLDGLLYRSAQAPKVGVNVVLFHKASRVSVIERPAGTEVDSSAGSYDGEDWYTEFRVIEWLPKPKPEGDGAPKADKWPLMAIHIPDTYPSGDDREVTLDIDLSAVTVDVIKEVRFEVDSHKVNFSRYNNSDVEM
jgi:hypothetical protein